ncbi:Cu+-exporting ATPase [Pseudarcicella hirudinis]|uniref:Cu+-exporting ATPase n=2 Tax=Pseudarcicella hirudinis TaxID=1079859 RepID=A0A1I5NW48_9BACT|nr:heavy metal translocating P-type ATPase metal-binding domain-containing protein [Pseudarcicella hirudinis]SFP25850.1 Cu+-exporting ATPase [Pseudarcicella hirudinis]
MKTLHIENMIACYHCGNECLDNHIHTEEKVFCCEGCKTVFEILDKNNLCNYYDLETQAGISPGNAHFEFLDSEQVINQLLDFKNEEIGKVTFFIPSIHCSSCLYLLENLYKLNTDILHSTVDFLKKQVSVTFRISVNEEEKTGITLRQLAELLTSLGYEPLVSLNDVVKNQQMPSSRKLITQIGVAGFCAGNIMLFSFPEYLGLNDPDYQYLFGYLNIALAIPVVFYSASDYFISVRNSLKNKRINIDFPILLGILTAFLRGTYEVLFSHGAGYFDSLSGLVFFLLIGKWFQEKTYSFLSFERDYKSFFPLAVTRIKQASEEFVAVNELKEGDKILIRNGELIPADSLLYKGNAQIDYSFVTGESKSEHKNPGDFLYAGGRHTGEKIEMEVLKSVSQSYLTQLWNNDAFQKNSQSPVKTFSGYVAKYFTIAVLILAVIVALYWYNHDTSRMWNAFTAILIIACPCALSLSYPFALGNSLRKMGKQHFYLKNAETIETLTQCDSIVFDKTGTLTSSNGDLPAPHFNRILSVFEEMFVASLVSNSTHPVSMKIKKLYHDKGNITLENFREITGKGLEATYHHHKIKLGSESFVIPTKNAVKTEGNGSFTHLSIDGVYVGYYALTNHYRKGVAEMLAALAKTHELFLLSGDNDAERNKLSAWFPGENHIFFECKPQQKLDFIKNLQFSGKRVIMIGDGLNDAGALKQADAGIAVTDNTLQFTPSSDAILEADKLRLLPDFLKYSKFSLKVIRFSFLISLIYNFIGLSFAVSGTLSPVVAAILMPVSSATMLLIASVGTNFRYFGNEDQPFQSA